jgi:hypothetical protein
MRWETLQWIIEALWPGGIGFVLQGNPIPDDEALRRQIGLIAKRYRKRDRQRV